MQAVRKNMQYSIAGVHHQQVMQVRSHVYLPDAQVCAETDALRKAYVHDGQVAPQPRKVIKVSRNGALIFLCMLFVFFGVQILQRVAQRSAESKGIAAMERSIAAVEAENRNLTVQLAQVRGASRICYRAVQELGMVSSAAVEAVLVEAPDTRPGWAANTTPGQPSPAAQGLIAGSR